MIVLNALVSVFLRSDTLSVCLVATFGVKMTLRPLSTILSLSTGRNCANASLSSGPSLCVGATTSAFVSAQVYSPRCLLMFVHLSACPGSG